MSFSESRARDLAMSALLHIAGQPELTTAFLAASGLRPQDLRGLAESPELAVHVLDFLLETDSRVVEAAEALSVGPQDLMAARVALAGPGSFGWEVD